MIQEYFKNLFKFTQYGNNNKIKNAWKCWQDVNFYSCKIMLELIYITGTGPVMVSGMLDDDFSHC